MAGIRIRMYRVGFGDCFLVSFDGKHVLVDCGVFRGTSGTGDINTIDDAVDDIIKETEGKLALIVMTHRHADHIAGFGRAADKFANLKVEDVWMPIWETEYDPRAKSFQDDLTSIAEDLQAHLDLQLAAGEQVSKALYHRVGNATGVEPDLAVAGKKKPRSKNKIALDLLKNRLGVKPQYLQAGDEPHLPKSLRSMGLSARVLGPPPIEDIDLMKLMDLKKGVGQYLALAALDATSSSGWQPFAAAWEVDPEGLSPYTFSEWMPWKGGELGHKADDELGRKARPRFEEVLDESTPEALALAAKKLDGFLNNQSLVILFTFHGKNLLFAGDAQGGNWEHWLFETDDAEKAPMGPLARSAKDILGTIDVYKVGHHGSTNATPKIVAKELRHGAVAMCSTEADVYGESDETAVPLEELMTALEDQRTLVRSDAIPVTVEGSAVETHYKLPKNVTGLSVGKFWVDYKL